MPIGTKHPTPHDFVEKYKVMTKQQLIRHYKLDRRVIQRFCFELGLVQPKVRTPSRLWTKAEEAQLADLTAQGFNAREIASALDRSPSAIESKRDAMGISRAATRFSVDMSGEFGEAEIRRRTVRLERAILKSAKRHGVLFVDTSRRAGDDVRQVAA